MQAEGISPLLRQGNEAVGRILGPMAIQAAVPIRALMATTVPVTVARPWLAAFRHSLLLRTLLSLAGRVLGEHGQMLQAFFDIPLCCSLQGVIGNAIHLNSLPSWPYVLVRKIMPFAGREIESMGDIHMANRDNRDAIPVVRLGITSHFS